MEPATVVDTMNITQRNLKLALVDGKKSHICVMKKAIMNMILQMPSPIA
jgi:hypothetical protein